ncbi:MAG: Rossmann-like and DUF2520 domain-containing protein [Schleiferiaceae bacterium]
MSEGRPHIAIVGQGNLGQHLASGLQNAFQITTHGRALDIPNTAEVIIVCVPDDATAQVCAALPQGALIVHTAGAVPMCETPRSGVLYPLYSFTKGATVNWAQVPFLLEAHSNEDLAILLSIAKALSPLTYEVNSAGRNQLHVSAVMVNNFTNHLYTLAFAHAKEHKLPVETLFAIMQQGPDKAIAMGPQAAQTGPASRGDQKTIDAHLKRITDPEVQRLYTLLSESIAKHKA